MAMAVETYATYNITGRKDDTERKRDRQEQPQSQRESSKETDGTTIIHTDAERKIESKRDRYNYGKRGE